MNKIPLARPFFDGREMELLAACLESGHVAQGPLVARLESGIEELLGGVHALAVSSGTAALHLAVRALDIGPGDEVIVPAFTWVATAHAVEYAGARAVFADVDPATFNVTVQSVERVLSPLHKGDNSCTSVRSARAHARTYGSGSTARTSCRGGRRLCGRGGRRRSEGGKH